MKLAQRACSSTARRTLVVSALAAASALMVVPAQAASQMYGDADVLGTGTYSSDPTAGATLEGLSAGSVSYATLITGHGYPFSPSGTDLAGTDQIYVGSVQTGFHDGYSATGGRISGPQTLTLDFSALVPAGQGLTSLTLGIAADDFQFQSFGQPFSATVNGVAQSSLSAALNALNQSGPQVQFFTIGLGTALDNGNHVLTLRIDQGGDGGDGWAVDFLTVGVTTAPIPEPATGWMLGAGLLALLGTGAARRRA